ncbi:hypothetical protein LTR22_022786 [Elasticomyces elasticus]|nr:hypothetical protein LTR22_022786 [Elasticomyces elasticus]KAK4904438.1 hypothetical protein LTR49_026122 [Elasticomyces elasticus]
MANNNSPALGDLGRLSGEVRNLIYELVIPEAQTCAFPTTKHYLPASRPGLIFASRKFHTEMLKMYYWRTNWTMTIKNTLTTGHTLVTTGNKAFKKSTSKKPVKVKPAPFSFSDRLSELKMNEDTPLIRHITLSRLSQRWPCLVFELQVGAAVFHHGISCPICSPDRWASAARDREKAWQAAAAKAAAELAQKLSAPSWRDRAAAYQQHRPVMQARFTPPAEEELSRSKERYEREAAEHDASLALFTATVLGNKLISVNGISVADLRDMARRINNAMSKELGKQHELVGSLRDLRRVMYGDSPLE